MSEPESGELVFVYGTLRRGGSNAFRMDGAEFVAAAEVPGRLYQISWYPGLVLDGGKETVTGDLYRVGAEQIKALDDFEGISANEVEGAEYRRVKATVLIERTEAVSAWVYEWKGPVDEEKRIPSGDWVFHLLGQPKPFFTLLSTLPLWSVAAFMVMVLSGMLDGLPDRGAIVFLNAFLLGVPLVGLSCAYFGEKRREEMRWLRALFASIAAVWLILVGFIALFGN